MTAAILTERIEFDSDQHYKMRFTPPQSNFLQSVATYPLFVGGFGSGKTTTMAASAVDDLLSFPGANIACYAPTFDLLSLITVPYICEILEGLHLPYRFIGGTKSWFEVPGYGRIICRSLSNPARIVGYEVFRSHIDELDTLKMHIAEDAWNKVIARNRQKIHVLSSNGEKILRADWKEVPYGEEVYLLEKNRVSAYTTPEGFMFCYMRWEKNVKPGYELFRAPTWSNPHLPDDYISNLESTYPAELIDAYINGLFVNLTSGSVYKSYDRKLNGTQETIIGNETLQVGMDFNVLYGAAVVHVMRNGNPHAVDEIHNSYDTDATIDCLCERYPENPIIVYPDASGDSRSSANTTMSDIKKIKAAGFKVKVRSKNPPIKNRTAAMNGMFCAANGERKYRVNADACPEYSAALEQQTYDKNGMPDKTAGLDHCIDAGGYFIEYEFGLTKPKSTLTVITGGY